MTEKTPKYKSKYRAIKTEIDGIKFDSRKEANYYGKLKLMKRAGEIIDIALQPEFPYIMTCSHPTEATATYTKRYKYIADFAVTYPDNHVEILDIKGCKTAEYKRKKKIIEAIYGVKIIEK